jgi:hypothetical protein
VQLKTKNKNYYQKVAKRPNFLTLLFNFLHRQVFPLCFPKAAPPSNVRRFLIRNVVWAVLFMVSITFDADSILQEKCLTVMRTGKSAMASIHEHQQTILLPAFLSLPSASKKTAQGLSLY